MKKFVGVDIGGTNTDLIFIDIESARLSVAKVPSTPHDQAEGLIEGIAALEIAASDIDLLIHGTTVATNAAIERTGARCGLITTAGFRDVLELRRRDRPNTYGLGGEFKPLIARRDRREVAERVSAEGEVLLALDVMGLKDQIVALRDEGCEVLVICFLHSYLNPVHERMARDIASTLWPNEFIVISSEVLPTLREFERTSTAAVSGYVQPLISRYLNSLGQKLGQAGYHKELLVVQSNGGVMSAPLATRFAANTILSGPAAGVTAATSIARDLGIDDIVSCDMGGTSLDICVIRSGVPGMTQNKSIDFGIPLGLPMLDVDAIGAGGGSLARIDQAGILQVGPQSAGSNPGPACFARGGSQPTVTDASLVVGLLKTETAIGKVHGVRMDRELASQAISEHIGAPLGLDTEKAAEAILMLTGAKMAGHVKRKLLARGLDPRAFSMIAFGGAGPVHACRILREVGLARAIIPYFPGITSALGCILGQLRHDFLRTVNQPLSKLSDAELATLFSEQSQAGLEVLIQEGHAVAAATVQYSADMCYRGQSNVIAVNFSIGALPSVLSIRSAFAATYKELYGRLLEEDTPIMLVNARTVVSTPADIESIAELIHLPEGPAPEPANTRVFFNGQWLQALQYERLALPAETRIAGPALLMQSDSTCFIEPGYDAVVHRSGNIFIQKEE